MEPFVVTLRMPKWQIEKMTGYKPKTTFWEDFSIAEMFGQKEIKDTFNRAFKGWKSNTEYITELVMVLSWKLFYWYDRNDDLALLYEELWKKADGWCCNNLKGEDLDYFCSTTD